MKIPTYLRFQIAAINDLCIDVGLAGKYKANTSLDVGPDLFALYLSTMPIGKRHGDPEAVSFPCSLHALTQPGWGGMDDPADALDYVRSQLDAMLSHLHALSDDSQEDAA